MLAGGTRLCLENLTHPRLLHSKQETPRQKTETANRLRRCSKHMQIGANILARLSSQKLLLRQHTILSLDVLQG